ncbi:hypothetical protein LCGC14_2312860 [marine sediment metagenome]|uniref:Uncharacterized protein n=1 Tax=marine sediment metagenome TaxID=412755 RepID=A0A0F9D7N9_9ZZZZ
MRYGAINSRTQAPGRRGTDVRGTLEMRYILPKRISRLFNKLHKPKPRKRKKIIDPTGYCKNTRCGKKLPELTTSLKPYTSKYCDASCCSNYGAWLRRQQK